MEATTGNQARYAELIAAARASGSLWLAACGERVLTLPDADGMERIPVWPSEDSARRALCAREDLAGFEPVVRALDRWLAISTPHLIEDGVGVAAYPDEAFACLAVSAVAFARDLSRAPTLQGAASGMRFRATQAHGAAAQGGTRRLARLSARGPLTADLPR